MRTVKFVTTIQLDISDDASGYLDQVIETIDDANEILGTQMLSASIKILTSGLDESDIDQQDEKN